jgi:hypothetical protein
MFLGLNLADDQIRNTSWLSLCLSHSTNDTMACKVWMTTRCSRILAIYIHDESCAGEAYLIIIEIQLRDQWFLTYQSKPIAGD